jgi:hypothetical protein
VIIAIRSRTTPDDDPQVKPGAGAAAAKDRE